MAVADVYPLELVTVAEISNVPDVSITSVSIVVEISPEPKPVAVYNRPQAFIVTLFICAPYFGDPDIVTSKLDNPCTHNSAPVVVVNPDFVFP